ncbi:MAG TPA: hypothetical protein VN030_00520 [Cellvibrio sp.]|nr:hypothetical protein [Cellvibrio sp.]
MRIASTDNPGGRGIYCIQVTCFSFAAIFLVFAGLLTSTSEIEASSALGFALVFVAAVLTAGTAGEALAVLAFFAGLAAADSAVRAVVGELKDSKASVAVPDCGLDLFLL